MPPIVAPPLMIPRGPVTAPTLRATACAVSEMLLRPLPMVARPVAFESLLVASSKFLNGLTVFEIDLLIFSMTWVARSTAEIWIEKPPVPAILFPFYGRMVSGSG